MVKRINLNKITRKGRALFLAYDQGLEHGPTDFNDKNVNPEYIIDIAKQGYTGIIFQKGVAEKYQEKLKESKVPLILKLNGKTNLVKGEPVSRQVCSVDEAVGLGAVAVGYTIYIGSEHESKMLDEFADIEEQAHKKGMPVIAWIYPRGRGVKGKSSRELMAYACRVGLEIGADIVKIKYNGKQEDLKWAVKSAGKTRVVIAGGVKKQESRLLDDVKEIMQAGAIGLAIGRNVWQSKEPDKITRMLKEVVL